MDKQMLEIDDSEKLRLRHEGTTGKIIGAAFDVHGQLGCRFLERVYQQALQVELLRCGASAELGKRVQVQYKRSTNGWSSESVFQPCLSVAE
jgi:hypothetical protein